MSEPYKINYLMVHERDRTAKRLIVKVREALGGNADISWSSAPGAIRAVSSLNLGSDGKMKVLRVHNFKAALEDYQREEIDPMSVLVLLGRGTYPQKTATLNANKIFVSSDWYQDLGLGEIDLFEDRKKVLFTPPRFEGQNYGGYNSNPALLGREYYVPIREYRRCSETGPFWWFVGIHQDDQSALRKIAYLLRDKYFSRTLKEDSRPWES